MLSKSTKYCTQCNDEKIVDCARCKKDSSVTIDFRSAKNLYKVKHLKWGQRYDLTQIENIALTTCKNNHPVLYKKFYELSERRKTFIKRYIEIREELIDVINKVFDFTENAIDIEVYRIYIESYSALEDDPMTSAFNIYHEIHNFLENDINRYKAKIVLNNFLKEKFNFLSVDKLECYNSLIIAHPNEQDMTTYLNDEKSVNLIINFIGKYERDEKIQKYIAKIPKSYTHLRYTESFKVNINKYVCGTISYEDCINNIEKIIQSIDRTHFIETTIYNKISKKPYMSGYSLKNDALTNSLIKRYINGEEIDKNIIIDEIVKIINSKESDSLRTYKKNLIEDYYTYRLRGYRRDIHYIIKYNNISTFILDDKINNFRDLPLDIIESLKKIKNGQINLNQIGQNC